MQTRQASSQCQSRRKLLSPALRSRTCLPLPWLVLLALACGACLAAAQGGGANTCPDGSIGACNSCICCCSKGGILSYEPDGCSCKTVYGKSFIAVVVLAVCTIVITIASGWFFGGSGALSPFPKAPTYDGPGRQYAI